MSLDHVVGLLELPGTKRYQFIGHVLSIEYHGEEKNNIKLELVETGKQHLWMCSPDPTDKILQKNIKEAQDEGETICVDTMVKNGDMVRIHFIHNGYAVAVHKLFSLVKMTLLDRFLYWITNIQSKNKSKK